MATCAEGGSRQGSRSPPFEIKTKAARAATSHAIGNQRNHLLCVAVRPCAGGAAGTVARLPPVRSSRRPGRRAAPHRRASPVSSGATRLGRRGREDGDRLGRRCVAQAARLGAGSPFLHCLLPGSGLRRTEFRSPAAWLPARLWYRPDDRRTPSQLLPVAADWKAQVQCCSGKAGRGCGSLPANSQAGLLGGW